MDESYLDVVEDLDSHTTIVGWFDDSITLYTDLQTLVTDYGYTSLLEGNSEEEILKLLYNNFSLMVVKKRPYSMKEIFGGYETSNDPQIIEML